MTLMDCLLKYVRTGTSEGDKSFLSEIFIAPSQFAQLCAIEPEGMRVLVGTKGVGKSAIVESIVAASAKRKIPCILMRPDNIPSKDLPSSTDIGSLKSHYYEVLLRAIAGQIGTQLKGLLTGDSAKLHTEARQAGLVEDDFIQKCLVLISAIAVPVAKVNGVQLAKDLAGTNSPNSLISAIKSQLLASGRVFYLLMDDTDQLASPDKPTHLNRIWALMLALRRLVTECGDVRAIVTLRSGVWSRMTTESLGQRDQTDHFRGLVISLLADDVLMERIVRRRLEAAAKDAGKFRVDPYGIFFDAPNMSLPGSDERRSWDDFILKSARERPRDAIQLIRNMVDSATERNVTRIGSAEAFEAMKKFSSERVDDVETEFSLDCANIREVLNTFWEVNFEVDFETLRKHLAIIPSIASTSIRGKLLRPDTDGDGILILALLHEVGFMNPCVPDASKSRKFRHINYQDDPSFVRMANWNSMQGAKWEIHPAFRSYLQGIRQSQRSRVIVASPKK